MNGPIVIYGAGGQDGKILAGIYREQGQEVIALQRSVDGIKGDVSNRDSVFELVQKLKPSLVYHLAANSTTRHEATLDHHDAICSGTMNLLEGIWRHSPETKLFLSGSAIQFRNQNVPISETDEFDPCNPYAIARIYSTHLARYYRQLGLKVYVGYFFHHESPYRSERHMSQKIAMAAARIAQGSNETLEIGNLDVIKEWGYAKDIMQGAMTLTAQNNVFEAVIGTGVGHSIREWVEACFQYFGLDWKNHVVSKDQFVPEYHTLISNPSTMASLGWAALTSLPELSKIMNDEALASIRS